MQHGLFCAWETAQLRGGLCMTGLKRLLTLQTTGTANLQLHAFGSQRAATEGAQEPKGIGPRPISESPMCPAFTRDTR